MIPRITIQEYITSREATPCSVSRLKEVMQSQRVQEICDQIKLLDGKDSDELARLKRQLPAITPHAQRFVDNHRTANNAISSGLAMLDLDHIENPRDIAARVDIDTMKSNGIYLVHITPSGQGLRVIGERLQGESIEAAQQRIAKLYSITEYDIAPKDLSRASYLVPMSYVLYMDESGLEFESQEEADKAAANKTPLALPPHVDSKTQSRSDLCRTKGTSEPEQPVAALDEGLTSSDQTKPGLNYKAIVRNLISILGGTPSVGMRNTFYYSLVRYIRYICDFNADLILSILPDFGLPLSERQGEVTRAVATPRSVNIPDELQRAIKMSETENVNCQLSTLNYQQPQLPQKLPRVLEAICKTLPESFHPAMVIASLPVLGTLATGVRFNYLDHQPHSFSFFSMITGPAATGKSFIRQPVNLLLTPIDEQDAIERAKAEQYRLDLRAAKNKKEQPEDPRACPRNNGINISIAKLLQLMDYSDGKHLIGVGEEIDTLLKSEKAGSWSQKSDIYRLAFDNAKYGQMYMSDNSYNYNGPVYYNLLLTGTPNGMYRFFHDVEDGLVTRVAFASLPDMRFTTMPEFQPFSKRDQAYIITTAKWLTEQNCHIECPKVDKAIAQWLEDKRIQALESCSTAMDTLRRRAAVMGFRAGYLAYTLNHYVYNKSVKDFALWVAEYVLQQQMLLFGDKFEQVATKQEEAMDSKGTVQMLFGVLPKTFSRADLMQLRVKNNQSSNVKMILSRWVKQALVEKNIDGTFTKLRV